MKKKIILVFFGISLSVSVKASNLSENFKDDSTIIAYLDTISYYLDSLNVKEQKYVLAQTLWETGWFGCKNCAWSKGNNLFGFRGENGYIKYKSWVNSVHAYSKWQDKKYSAYLKKHPDGSYMDFLSKSGYSQTSEYKKNINYMINWLDKNYYN